MGTFYQNVRCVNSTANCTLTKNDTTHGYNQDQLEFVNMIYLIILGVFSVVIVLGNGLVIIVTCARRRLRAQVSPNWFVLSLATADCLVGFFSFTNSIICMYSSLFEEICSNPRFYYAQNFLMNVFYTASVMNLCILTLDIYLGLIHPYKYQSFKKTSTVSIFITLAWVLSVLQNVPLAVYQMSDSHPQKALLADNVIQIGFMTGLPNLFMFYAYAKIFRVARKHRKEIEKMEREIAANEPLTKNAKKHKRGRSGTVKSVGVVVAIFLFCNVFYQYYVLCDIWPDKINMHYYLRIATLLLRHFNSAPNFFVYAFMRKDFRREMKALVRCCRKFERKPSTDVFTL